MGMLLPVLVAYVALCNGGYVFREPKSVANGPLVSTYVFTFSSFLLLWDIRLYPRSLRKLDWFSQGIIEYFIAGFLLENLLIDFWFPLESGVLSGLKCLATLIEEMLQKGNWSCEKVCDVLRNEKVGFAASYLLSSFFLLAVLHATRAIDLRELIECGPNAFFKDIVTRSTRFFKKTMRSYGLMKTGKRVQIKECPSKKSKSNPKSCIKPKECDSFSSEFDLTFTDDD